jgi:Ca2+-binding EF-hand superfamily protein
VKSLLLFLTAFLLAAPAFADLPGTDLLADLIIKQFDRDHDSMIDINEWKNGTNDGFDEVDTDRDGFISESEIDALSEPLSEEFTKLGAIACVALIKKVLYTFDTDGDHRISKAEYEQGCASLFKLLDVNHDGILTKSEIADLPIRLFQGATRK